MLNKYKFISDGKITKKSKTKKKVELNLIERKEQLKIQAKNSYGVIERDVIIENTNREIKRVFDEKPKDEVITKFKTNSQTIIYLTRYSDSAQQSLRQPTGQIRNIIVEEDDTLKFLELIIVTKHKKSGNIRHRYISRRS